MIVHGPSSHSMISKVLTAPKPSENFLIKIS